MKKFLKIGGVVFLLLVITVIAIPYLFKDRIVQVIKDNVNASLNAKVDFGDFDLTLIPNFPNFTFQVEDITIDGVMPFDSVRLASIGEAAFTLDIMSVIKGEKMKIQGVSVDELFLNALVLEDGTANYDIIKASETETGDTTDVRDEYVILLEQYEFSNVHIIYDNRSMQMYLEIEGMNHSGNGDLTYKIYDLMTVTTAEKVGVVYEGIRYLKDAEAEIMANFDIQDDFRTYNLKENEIRCNQLYLTASGVVLMPEDGVDMDITYQSTKTDLKNLLSLVPADYMPDLEGLKTEGKVTLRGDVKGHYDDFNLPGFSIIGAIENGRIQYPGLPQSIDNINTDLSVIFPGGVDFDAMSVEIKQLHLEVAQSPINASFFTKNMLTDPYIKSDIKSQLNLANVKEAISLEGVQDLEGIITADLSLEGRMSAIEQERYEDFKATGQVIMQDFLYRTDSMPDTRISIATLNFNPRYLELPDMRMTIGKSDLAAQGRITNYLAYYLKDETIQGMFNVQSNLMDMNEFMTEEEVPAEGTAAAEETPMALVNVPGNVDVDLNTTIKTLKYGDMEMKNVQGK
ncbi:MAG: AsmA family protein, partial [Bacteroidetes bacterium]|nr:AsmA family protein [Bacteroidota bacterium]